VDNPLAKHVPVDNTKIKVDNPLAKHVLVVDIKIIVSNLLAKHVAPASTTTWLDNPMNPLPANFAVLGNTTASQDN